jgi:hypothetical protein
MSNNWEQSVSPAGTDGDIDGDGVVGFSDFVILSNNWGQTAPPAAAAIPVDSALTSVADEATVDDELLGLLVL